MRLTIFNGSPRGIGSNTRILLTHFLNGFMSFNDNQHEIYYLSQLDDLARQVDAFKNAEQVILAFPLYTDAMPGIVKNFIESLEPFCGREENPRLGFIVQSGFPEPIHTLYLEKYLAKLAQRLGCNYIGTVRKGGQEGIKDQPAWMTKKVFQSFFQLGIAYTLTGRFDEKIIQKFTQPERMSRFKIGVYKFLQKIGIINFYWDNQLKKNNVFEKRFAQSFSE